MVETALVFPVPSAAREQAQRQGHLAFIVEENGALEGLNDVRRAMIARQARISPLPDVATIDQDATFIESRKREASHTYKGMKGYQPVLAAWAEAGLVVADEFRDGNVPAQMAPLNCAKQAFASLPGEMQALFFRGTRPATKADSSTGFATNRATVDRAVSSDSA